MSDSEASIGLRIYLEDTASAGFRSLEDTMQSFADSIEVMNLLVGEGFDRTLGTLDTFVRSMVALSEESTQAADSLERIVSALSTLDRALEESVLLDDTEAVSLTTIADSALHTVSAITDLSAAQIEEADTIDNVVRAFVDENGALTKLTDSSGNALSAADAIGTQYGTMAETFAKLTGQTIAETDAVEQNVSVLQRLADMGSTVKDALGHVTESVTTFGETFAQSMLAAQQIMSTTHMDTFFTGQTAQIITDSGNLEEALTRVQIVTHTTGKAWDELSAYIVTTANNSAFSGQEVAAAFENMAERGYTAAQLIGVNGNGVGQALIDFAEVTHSQVLPASDLLIATMRTFGAQASDARTYADMLTHTFQNGIPNVSGLKSAIENVGGAAAALHMPFADVAGALDWLTNNGLPDASSAGNSLRYMISGLTDPLSKAAKEFANLGLITVSATQPLRDLQAALDASVKNAPQFDGTVTSLQQMYTAMQKVTNLRTDKSFNEWAISSGIMSSSLYDLEGHAKSLPDIFQAVGDKIRALPTEELQHMAEDNIFNVKGGQGGRLIMSDPNAAKSIAQNSKNIAGAAQGGGESGNEAKKLLDDYNIKLAEVSTSIMTFRAAIGTPIINFLKPLLDQANNMIAMGQKMSGPGAQIRTFIMTFMLVGAATVPIVTFIAAIGMLTVFISGAAIAIGGGIVVAIMLLAVGIAFMVTHWKQIQPAIQPFLTTMQKIGDLLQKVVVAGIKDFIAQTLGIMKVNGTLSIVKTAFDTMVQAMSHILPAVKPIGAILLLVFGAAFGAVIHSAIGLIAGIAVAFMGIVTVLMGVIKFIGGFLNFFVGIILMMTGHSDQGTKKIAQGWGQMVDGIITILKGLWQTIVGIFMGLWLGVMGILTGFISGVIAFFTHLWDVLVGHSIIPDMVRGIISWFGQLPGQVIAFITGLVLNAINWFMQLQTRVGALVTLMVQLFLTVLGSMPGQAGALIQSVVSTIINAISGLGTSMYQSGVNAINMLANGIRNAIGSVTSAVSGVAGSIKSALGFNSPPEGGPLADSDKYMPNMMKMYATGILQHKHLVTNATDAVASGMASSINSPTVARLQTQAYVAAQAQNGTTILNLNVDGKNFGQASFDSLTGDLKMNSLGRMLR